MKLSFFGGIKSVRRVSGVAVAVLVVASGFEAIPAAPAGAAPAAPADQRVPPIPLVESPPATENVRVPVGGDAVADGEVPPVPEKTVEPEWTPLDPAKAPPPTKRERVDSPPLKGPKDGPRGYVEGKSKERIDERSATTQVFDNPDGSTAERISPIPRFWKQKGEWVPIDSTLRTDRSGLIVSGSNSFTASFDPTVPGVTVRNGKDSVTFLPVDGAASSKAVVDGSTVTYTSVWPSVDVRYTVTETGVKEDLVVTGPTTRSKFEFAMDGLEVDGRPPEPTKEARDTTKSADAAEKNHALDQGIDPPKIDRSKGFELSTNNSEPLVLEPPVVMSGDENHVVAEAAPTLDKTERGVSVTVDESWLSKLPGSSFPVVIDPTITAVSGDWYMSYKMRLY